jgi:hypothetical protein
LILKKLRTAKGVSIDMLIAETGWQAHSVRGFLSAVVKKKLALDLVSESGKDGVRRYRIASETKRASMLPTSAAFSRSPSWRQRSPKPFSAVASRSNSQPAP